MGKVFPKNQSNNKSLNRNKDTLNRHGLVKKETRGKLKKSIPRHVAK